MLPHTVTSTLAAAVLFLGSTSAYSVEKGNIFPTNGRHGLVQCVCFTDQTNTVTDRAATKNGCINIPGENGQQYPEDPQDYGECIFHTYEGRVSMMNKFQRFCTTGWVQCCNAQGSETSTQCVARGPNGQLPPTVR